MFISEKKYKLTFKTNKICNYRLFKFMKYGIFFFKYAFKIWVGELYLLIKTNVLMSVINIFYRK